MPMNGGEARAITDIPRGAAGPEWAPDGQDDRVLVDGAGRGADAGKTGEKPREADVRVITEAVYRANGVSGSGFVDRDRPSQIWTVAVSAADTAPASPKRITSGEFAAGNYHWSTDGAQIFFVADRRPRVVLLLARQRPLCSAERWRRAEAKSPASMAASAPTRSRRTASGSRLSGSLAGKPERSFTQPDLWVIDLPGGTPRNLTAAFDFDMNGGLGGDQRAPRGQIRRGRSGQPRRTDHADQGR